MEAELDQYYIWQFMNTACFGLIFTHSLFSYWSDSPYMKKGKLLMATTIPSLVRNIPILPSAYSSTSHYYFHMDSEKTAPPIPSQQTHLPNS